MRQKRRARSLPHAGRRQPLLPLLALPALASILIFSIYPGAAYLPAAFKNWTPPMPLAIPMPIKPVMAPAVLPAAVSMAVACAAASRAPASVGSE